MKVRVESHGRAREGHAETEAVVGVALKGVEVIRWLAFPISVFVLVLVPKLLLEAFPIGDLALLHAWHELDEEVHALERRVSEGQQEEHSGSTEALIAEFGLRRPLLRPIEARVVCDDPVTRLGDVVHHVEHVERSEALRLCRPPPRPEHVPVRRQQLQQVRLLHGERGATPLLGDAELHSIAGMQVRGERTGRSGGRRRKAPCVTHFSEGPCSCSVPLGRALEASQRCLVELPLKVLGVRVAARDLLHALHRG